MVPLTDLIVATAIASVLVFVASSLVHMVLKWHNSDYLKLPNEEEVRAALKGSAGSPGQYVIPHCLGPKDMTAPGMAEKFREGPVAMLAIRAPGTPGMGRQLGQWFVLIVVITGVAAYLAARTLPAGAGHLTVCRLVALVTFLAYGCGSVVTSIWMGKTWSSTLKDLLDSFIYALVTALTFAFMWPR